jgi:hypothetical protein
MDFRIPRNLLPLAALFAAVAVTPAAAEEIAKDRSVTFRGERMTCGELYELSENTEYAGKFQEYRKRALAIRESIQVLEEQLDRLETLGEINDALHMATYAVEAFSAVTAYLDGRGLLEICCSVQSIAVSGVLDKLRGLAKQNDAGIEGLKREIQRELPGFRAFADQAYADSNTVIQTLMDARVELREHCQP